MQIGMSGTALVATASVDSIRAHARAAANDGFTSYSIAEHPTGGFDALTVLALVGQDLPDMHFSSAVIPTMPRHPIVLAGQARTVANALDGRFTLGVGLSHAVMMAELGIAFDKPIRHLREYLSILVPLLQTGSVDYQGETLSCKAQLFGTPSVPCPVVVAALGPQALKVAGSLSDGTTLAWVGPKTIREHISPRIHSAAEVAGREAPRIIASLPVCVTADAPSVRKSIDATAAMYSDLPSYRAMFDREGARGPGDVAIVGSEDAVLTSIDDMRRAGVTEFTASEYGSVDDRARTRALLTTLLGNVAVQ
jgi:F420-dependent oxidoreductase-like protein